MEFYFISEERCFIFLSAIQQIVVICVDDGSHLSSLFLAHCSFVCRKPGQDTAYGDLGLPSFQGRPLGHPSGIQRSPGTTPTVLHSRFFLWVCSRKPFPLFSLSCSYFHCFLFCGLTLFIALLYFYSNCVHTYNYFHKIIIAGTELLKWLLKLLVISTG